MSNLKNLLLTGLIAAVVGYAIGKFTTPTKVEVQEKVNVVKETEVVYREIKQADGTVIKETVTKDTAKKETDKSSKVVNEKAKNDISVLVSYDFSEKKEIYGIHYQRRLGDTPFKAGIFGVSTGVLGLSVGIEL